VPQPCNIPCRLCKPARFSTASPLFHFLRRRNTKEVAGPKEAEGEEEDEEEVVSGGE